MSYNYDKLTAEAFKMYESFLKAGFCVGDAFELTRFCIKEFPIFKDLIVEEFYI